MKIKEEIRTFTNDAHELSLKMIVVADEINLGTISAEEGFQKLDRMARDLAAITDTIKDLAYRLKMDAGKEVTVTLTTATPKADGSFETRSAQVPLETVLPALQRVPALWAHKHYNDETENDFNDEFADACDICRDRLELAIEEGRRCEAHPKAYFEPRDEKCEKTPAFPYCEECEEEGRPVQDHGKAVRS